MTPFLAAACFAAVVAGTQTDTTIAVRPGSRLDLDNFSGPVAVSTWNRSAVRIEASASGPMVVAVDARGPVVLVRSNLELPLVEGRDGVPRLRRRVGGPAAVSYRITVPRWMEIKLSTVLSNIHVEGVEAAVNAETVKGDVTLRGGRGYVRVSSVQGGVDVQGARGRVEAHAVNEDVRLHDIDGEISAESINGAIALDDIQSSAVEGTSVNGDITWLGSLRRDGRYHFATHNGDILVLLPGTPDAAVSVQTYNGDFESSFGAQVRALRGRQYEFSLGRGSAELELESFQGAIRLMRDDARGRELVKEKIKVKVKVKDKLGSSDDSEE